ncbi:MAG: oxidoreductase [Acidimicrobiaceae bacterium]|nr:oxidoreductase [Acidimicrobiaceae bacterium]
MVGGGQGAFIGAVHRIASRIDGRFDLVAGALSSDPARASASAAELGIKRTYDNYEAMAINEAARDDGIDAVAIVTPNHMHAAPAIAFLNANIHVICDKPLAATAEEATTIQAAFAESKARFFMTYNYTGYPLIRQAREMVACGDLGDIRIIQAEYAQDWLTGATDQSNKQADWRTDPARAGAGCIGDIGTHAFNLAAFVTNMVPCEISAELSSFVPGRKVDDNAFIRLRYRNGARGTIWSSQVAVGCENGLKLRIYGDKGGLEWEQENPNQITFARFGEPKQIITRGGAGLGKGAERWTRIPPGHPEGYLEGFANLYNDIADIISGTNDSELVPDLNAGLDGMWFISSCLASSEANGSWIDL